MFRRYFLSTYQRVVGIESHPKLLQSRKKLSLYVPGNGIVHALVRRRSLPSV